MSRDYDIAALKAAIGPIPSEDNPVLVRQKSRDFYWYSPILKRELERVIADIIVTPRDEAEIAVVLAASLSPADSRDRRAGLAPAITARRCRSPAASS